jgi:hypothetical protein
MKLFQLANLHCLLLLGLGLGVIVSPAQAAEPGLLDYLRAGGIGGDAFAKFSDDRQIANEELEIIRRIAVRLRDCPSGPLGGMLHKQAATGRLPALAEAKAARGRTCELHGTIESVEPIAEPGCEPLWRCVVSLSADPRRAAVYVAQLPERLRSGTGQRVACDAVFLKYVPGVKEPMPVVAAPRLEWRPESPLGNLGMDFNLFDGVHDGTAMAAADHDAFYCLLLLAKNADPDRLARDAVPIDGSSQGLKAFLREPAAQRGRLVTFSAALRRVVRVPIDESATKARLGTDHYFEIDLVPSALPSNPVVLCTLDLPEGITPGVPPADASMTVTGFFFKDWVYPAPLSEEEKAAHPGSSRAFQTAPLLIGAAPVCAPVATAKKSSSVAAVGGLLALVMAGVCLLLWHLRQSDQEFYRRVFDRER